MFTIRTIITMTHKTRNPVAKFNNEFNKPKTFRNRKKKAKMEGDYQEHPKHQPYHREQLNIQELLETEDEYGD